TQIWLSIRRLLLRKLMLPIMRIPTFPPTGITTIPRTRVTTATAALATALAAVHALSKAVDRGLPRDRPNEDIGRSRALCGDLGRPSTSALGRRDFAPDICRRL